MRLKKEPIQIGADVFTIKKAAQEAIRGILYAYRVGESLSRPDFLFMLDLLGRHPESEGKIGRGIASMQIQQNGPTRGFWITRTDGTRTDFSYLSCLTPNTARKNALAGMRSAVMGQITEFRRKTFAETATRLCPITGEEITAQTAHIDHEVPFIELVHRYLSEGGLTLDAVEVLPTADGDTVTELADPVMQETWQLFHVANAKLRAVSKRANLSVLRRGS